MPAACVPAAYNAQQVKPPKLTCLWSAQIVSCKAAACAHFLHWVARWTQQRPWLVVESAAVCVLVVNAVLQPGQGGAEPRPPMRQDNVSAQAARLLLLGGCHSNAI